MSDSAEFEKLRDVERRLAQALDRIDTQVEAMVLSDRAMAEEQAARQEAEESLSEARGRSAQLEEQLSETQGALSEAQSDLARARGDLAKAKDEMPPPGSDAAALTALEAKLAEVEASRGAAQAELASLREDLASRDARIADLEKVQAEAASKAQGEGAAAPLPEVGGLNALLDELEDLERGLAVMTRRAERARAERDAAVKETQTLRDRIERDAEAVGDVQPLRDLTAQVEALSAELAALLADDSRPVDAGLMAQCEALRAARAAEAAELARIIAQIEQEEPNA